MPPRSQRYARFRAPRAEENRKKRAPCPDGERICLVKECLNITLKGSNACAEHEAMFDRVRHSVAGGATRTNKQTSYVYFVRMGEDGAIKIGSSVEPAHRLSSLQTGMPEQLYLLGVCGGGRAKERELHKLFEDFRRRGEWFAPAPEILEWVKKHTRPFHPE